MPSPEAQIVPYTRVRLRAGVHVLTIVSR